jgi:MFS family permease
VQPPADSVPGGPPSFRAVLRHRHCARLLTASVVGRLPLGMVPVALILAARSDGHSLATAGLLAALYGIAPAAGLPLLGRLADLRGLIPPCHLGAVLSATALTVLAAAGTSHLPLTAVCVILAGAGCPPLEGGLRSLWPVLLPDAAHVRTAYTLDASTQQIVYVTGPALAIAITGWLCPSAALALAAAATLTGTLAFTTTTTTPPGWPAPCPPPSPPPACSAAPSTPATGPPPRAATCRYWPPCSPRPGYPLSPRYPSGPSSPWPCCPAPCSCRCSPPRA